MQFVEKIVETAVDQNQLQRIEKTLQYRYPYGNATVTPSKMTATQLKGRQKDEEAAENTQIGRAADQSWRKPSFISVSQNGRSYGNAIHKAMQYIRYDACDDPAAVSAELERLVSCRFLTTEEAAAVDGSKIAAFFATDLGKKLREDSKVLREFKFSILEDAGRFDKALAGEQILLQGVVDCALVEDDGITVIDFKTDYVTENTLDQLIRRYRSQIDTYANALERIYRRKVKARYLFLFHLMKFVPV